VGGVPRRGPKYLLLAAAQDVMAAGAECPSCVGGFGGGPDAESASSCFEEVEEGDFVAVGSQVQGGSVVVVLLGVPASCELV
jgi:hypothetical protein